MTNLIDTLCAYAAIWIPAIVAVFGTVLTLVSTLAKTKAAYAELSKDQVLKELKSQMSVLLKQNEELNKDYRLLLDQMTKIKDYANYKE